MPEHPPIVFNEDNPEWTADDFARARPIAEFPELAAAFPKARGRPRDNVATGTFRRNGASGYSSWSPARRQPWRNRP